MKTRQSKLAKIRTWLKKHNMTAADIGVDGPIEKADDDVIDSIIDDIKEEQDRKDGEADEYSKSLEYDEQDE